MGASHPPLDRLAYVAIVNQQWVVDKNYSRAPNSACFLRCKGVSHHKGHLLTIDSDSVCVSRRVHFLNVAAYGGEFLILSVCWAPVDV